MNQYKICFITCVNDEELYKESVRYIESLQVPEGILIEFISIRNASCMTEGYNRGMKMSDAKYKVYMHQDVFIVNKQFISNILDVFYAHPKVGMLGVIGAKQLPSSGVWWESEEQFGVVIENSFSGKMRILSVGNVRSDIEIVEGIDGLIMITQYDIPWKEDIFDGWHFYDISQSMEFIKAGYHVGIPRQNQPWCVHDCGVPSVESYDLYQQKFLDYYGFVREDSK